MSDAAVNVLVAGVLQALLAIVGFFTLWIKVKYGTDAAKTASNRAEASATVAATKVAIVEDKIDANTVITAQTKASTEKIERQTNGAMNRHDDQIADHGNRINSLELQMTALKLAVDTVTKTVDSTRHEMRGHLQAVVSKLDIMAAKQIA